MSEYTKALAASMQATKQALNEALARNVFLAVSRRDKETNNEIHGAKHGIHKDTKTL
jgi:hypothetical protein